jgi:Transposase, Mutator family
LPILYLRGVSAGDFQEALAALLGKDAPNLSPSVIARLKSEWEAEYARWQRRELSARRYWTAPDRKAADAAVALFAEQYGAKYERAVACLVKDRDTLPDLSRLPAEHWDHLRTANPIESVFATVRHRTVRDLVAQTGPVWGLGLGGVGVASPFSG